jgi:hypothetical protein
VNWQLPEAIWQPADRLRQTLDVVWQLLDGFQANARQLLAFVTHPLCVAWYFTAEARRNTLLNPQEHKLK